MCLALVLWWVCQIEAFSLVALSKQQQPYNIVLFFLSLTSNTPPPNPPNLHPQQSSKYMLRSCSYGFLSVACSCFTPWEQLSISYHLPSLLLSTNQSVLTAALLSSFSFFPCELKFNWYADCATLLLSLEEVHVCGYTASCKLPLGDYGTFIGARLGHSCSFLIPVCSECQLGLGNRIGWGWCCFCV